ncbi:MAG TPA: JDVT-CTERM system glutamic-type intramembrane protease [Gammaproteobacteria bacterium]|jgi:membrane protease YdiL (CAAX protease family)|nr:JDVT-CTERM system glutamic-type intramembrane protease [Gammaproteobacteria bacterium]HRP86178.1 JDVT-CTERM system glutamic-type intramembrane protease [Gammaproteobacteria bacterium]
MITLQAATRPWRDPWFFFALAAGPAAWALLALWLPLAEPGWPAVQPGRFLVLAVLYPVLEELVFRGWLQGALLNRGWGRRIAGPVSAANLAAALGFATAHLLRTSPAWAAAVILPGLVFGGFRERHGVGAAIALHMFYNAGFFWLFGA